MRVLGTKRCLKYELRLNMLLIIGSISNYIYKNYFFNEKIAIMLSTEYFFSSRNETGG